MRVLVVDDDVQSRDQSVRIMEENKIEVLCKNSASEALEYLDKEGLVDLILSDIVMPDVNGFEFLSTVKSTKRLSKIPFILCTGKNDKETVIRGIELGAADFIAKPLRSEVFAEKVRKAIENGPGIVMVVDDEEFIRDMLYDSLGREGYRVVCAQNGPEAIRMMVNNKISVVISDIQMPEMDGFELSRKIKTNHPEIPVLLMTGRSEYLVGEAVKGSKADGFIKKPFRNTEIINKIETILKKAVV